MENLKKVSRAQWCLFALFIGFAFLMQNCQDDDALIYEENQIKTDLNAKPTVGGKVDVCRYNDRKGTYSVISVVTKRVLPGDVYYGQDGDNDGYYRMSGCPELGNPSGEGYWDCDDTNSTITTTTNFYRDADNDTFGNPSDSFPACVAPEGYVANNTDCDDSNSALNTGAEEICGDEIDNNCDGTVDEGCLVERTYVPDDYFEQALIDLGYDNVLDDYVDTENISSVTMLNLDYKNISELTGIEDFIALTNLNCNSNNLTFIDVSKNTALNYFGCYDNPLTSIDVSYNTSLINFDCWGTQLTSLDVTNNAALVTLSCGSNQLTSLDVSNNTALMYLFCDENDLTSLDVSNNTALIELWCNDNQLTSLDLSNNNALTDLYCQNNPDLNCIQVNSTQYNNIPPYWYKDYDTWYDTYCS